MFGSTSKWPNSCAVSPWATDRSCPWAPVRALHLHVQSTHRTRAHRHSDETLPGRSNQASPRCCRWWWLLLLLLNSSARCLAAPARRPQHLRSCWLCFRRRQHRQPRDATGRPWNGNNANSSPEGRREPSILNFTKFTQISINIYWSTK
jgi:hypothetical protein